LEKEAPNKKVWDKTNSWGDELALLRSIIAKTPLTATTKWGGEVFTFEGKNVVGIAGFKNFFTIWFYNGALLKDAEKLLINAQEGKTKLLRQWRFTAKDQIKEELILEYILEAIALV